MQDKLSHRELIVYHSQKKIYFVCWHTHSPHLSNNPQNTSHKLCSKKHGLLMVLFVLRETSRVDDLAYETLSILKNIDGSSKKRTKIFILILGSKHKASIKYFIIKKEHQWRCHLQRQVLRWDELFRFEKLMKQHNCDYFCLTKPVAKNPLWHEEPANFW